MSDDMLGVLCSECGQEVRLVVDSIVNHSARKYSSGSGSYSISVKAKCMCERESPKATELDSIRFHGDPPEGWQ